MYFLLTSTPDMDQMDQGSGCYHAKEWIVELYFTHLPHDNLSLSVCTCLLEQRLAAQHQRALESDSCGDDTSDVKKVPKYE